MSKYEEYVEIVIEAVEASNIGVTRQDMLQMFEPQGNMIKLKINRYLFPNVNYVYQEEKYQYTESIPNV